jgi:hypothetical protein
MIRKWGCLLTCSSCAGGAPSEPKLARSTNKGAVQRIRKGLANPVL